MSPELSAILESLAALLVKRPGEVQMLSTLVGADQQVVSSLLKDAADVAASVENNGEAASAILQKIIARKGEIMPRKAKQVAGPTYIECPHCHLISKH